MSGPGPSYIIGAGASASNTVDPGSVCKPVSNMDDLVKEGNRLSLLRLNSSETAVMIGGRQALFIETANDGLSGTSVEKWLYCSKFEHCIPSHVHIAIFTA